MNKSGVQVNIIQGEPCDGCRESTLEPVYVFKVRQPEGRFQLWLHKRCLAALTEKLWMMEAKKEKTTK